ncbi:hypothetical protein MBANPS3_002287 [Mucor bainieri]
MHPLHKITKSSSKSSPLSLSLKQGYREWFSDHHRSFQEDTVPHILQGLRLRPAKLTIKEEKGTMTKTICIPTLATKALKTTHQTAIQLILDDDTTNKQKLSSSNEPNLCLHLGEKRASHVSALSVLQEEHEVVVSNKPNWNCISTCVINDLITNRLPRKPSATSTSAEYSSPPVPTAVAVCSSSSPMIVTDSPSIVSSASIASTASTASTAISSFSAGVSLSTDGSGDTNISMKLAKLCDEDKKRVDSIQKVVMEIEDGHYSRRRDEAQVANTINHDPSHSMILDLSDQCCSEAFEPEERQEIRNHDAISMPELSSDVASYLEELQGLTDDALYDKLQQQDKFPMDSDME